MIEVHKFDWKEDVSRLIEVLQEKWQGRKCFFYPYDEGSDEYVLVISDKELTEDQVKYAVDNFNGYFDA